jgi:TIR domain
MLKCFISYRRARPHAPARFAEQLSASNVEVFFDIDGIPVGEKFPDIIERSLRRSDVLFVAIDDEWLVDEEGVHRLNNPRDWVRREIELALELRIPVIPVLIDKASMPRQDDLPESLRELTEFQSVRLRHEDFKADFNRIRSELEVRSKLQREAEATLEKIRDPWRKGNWLQIHRRLVELTASLGQEQSNRVVPRLISRQLATSQQLARAAEALSQRRFDEAVTILRQIPLDDAPPNVPCSLKLSEMGVRAALACEAGRLEAIESVSKE